MMTKSKPNDVKSQTFGSVASLYGTYNYLPSIGVWYKVNKLFDKFCSFRKKYSYYLLYDD